MSDKNLRNTNGTIRVTVSPQRSYTITLLGKLYDFSSKTSATRLQSSICNFWKTRDWFTQLKIWYNGETDAETQKGVTSNGVHVPETQRCTGRYLIFFLGFSCPNRLSNMTGSHGEDGRSPVDVSEILRWSLGALVIMRQILDGTVITVVATPWAQASTSSCQCPPWVDAGEKQKELVLCHRHCPCQFLLVQAKGWCLPQAKPLCTSLPPCEVMCWWGVPRGCPSPWAIPIYTPGVGRLRSIENRGSVDTKTPCSQSEGTSTSEQLSHEELLKAHYFCKSSRLWLSTSS